MNAKAGYSLAAIIAILIFSTLVAGFAAAASMAFMTVWLGAPGFAAFGNKGMLTNPERTAAILLSGLALSLISITLAGCLFDHFSLYLAISVCPLLCILLYYLRTHKLSGSVNAHNRDWIHHKEPTTEETAFLWLSVLIVFALIALPLIGVGTATAGGATFRPYFNADFFKHAAITNSFLLGQLPPIDPFGATDRLHYYWLQHLFPATGLAAVNAHAQPMKILLAAGIIQTVLMTVVVFGLARRFSKHAGSAFIALTLGMASLSMDGMAAQLVHLFQPWLEVMRTINMEALDLTELYGAPYHISGSTLYRLQLYIPQHQLSATFFLAYLLLSQAYTPNPASRIVEKALLVALPASSILLGIPLLAVAAAIVLLGCWRNRKLPSLSILFTFLIALALPLATGMFEFGFANNIATSTHTGPNSSVTLLERLIWLPFQWLTTLGPLVVLAGIAWWWLRTYPGRTQESDILLAIIMVATMGYIAAEWLLPLGRLRIDIELKLSFLASIASIAGSAFFFAALRHSEYQKLIGRRYLYALSPLFLFGLLSPTHDVIWHSCLHGGCVTAPRQAVTIPVQDLEAMEWARKNTPSTAIFQQFPEPGFLAGGRDVWVPVFAGRPVLASPRGTNTTPGLLKQVRSLFEPAEGIDADRFAESLGIEYLYLSRALTPDSYDRNYLRFSSQPGLAKIFSNDDVSIWKVGIQGAAN
jgi:hypothetical protein